MDWKQSYNDICAELSILHLHELELRKRWEKARLAMDTHVLPLDKAIEAHNHAADTLNEHVKECERVESIKKDMERYMSQFDTLENIIECKLMQGIGYPQMSKELCYSEKYLRNYRSKMKNKGGKKVEQSTSISC